MFGWSSIPAYGGRVVRSLLLVLVVTATGCSRCGGTAPPRPAGSTEADKAAAAQAVERYYAAVSSGDCATVASILQKQIDRARCAELQEAAEHHPMSLVKIIEIKPDGRDTNVALVRAIIRKKTDAEALLQVERTPKGWRLRL